MPKKLELTEEQNKQSIEALNFYGIKHQGKFTEDHIKELEKARMTPCPKLKEYAYSLHEEMFDKILDPKADPYAPPGPDSKAWIGAVYKEIPGL